MDKTLQSSLFGLNRSMSGTPKSVLSRNKAIFPSKRNISLSGRSNASTLQIVARSEYNVVEFFGNQIPVKVNEILTFSDRNTAVSVNFSKNGWAWAVSGRKLLVWQYKDTRVGSTNSDSAKSAKRSGTGQCRLLTLPHCDIGNKARLITVFTPENSQMAACLAVSTTGDVRYWPSIAHDGSSIDENGILEGQEFDQLTSINQLGYLLVTTTCNLVLLQLQVQNGRQKIIHRTIRPPTGFFGGIGKRFSIIIGMNSDQESENKLIKICYESINTIEYHVSVLSDHSLQRWLFSPNTNDTFLFEDSDVQKKIREMYRQKVWTNRDMNENVTLWMLDMQTVSRGVMILVGAANLTHTPEIHFSLVTFIAENEGFQLKEFQLLRFKSFYNYNDQQNKCLSIKFIICRGMAYIYSDKIIYPVLLGASSAPQNMSEDVEKIEFQNQDDKIMYAANHSNIPLFFSRNHGLVCVSPSDFEPDFFNSSVSSDVFSPITASDASMNIFSPNTTNAGNLTMYELDPEEMYEEGKDKDPVSLLKAAFLYHLKRNNNMCNSILSELFQETQQIDGNLDRIVLTIAEDLSEDVPAADPRWEVEGMNKHALGSSSSMQIIQQLREKNLALGHFIDFLHASNLWEKLYAVSDKSGPKSTCHLLSDINEKIVATISLKCLHNSHNRIIDEAIDLVLKENQISIYGSLTNQDIFYTKITKVQEVFKKFVEIIENYINLEVKTSQIQTALIEVNVIILQVLQEIIKFRETKQDLFKLPNDKKDLFEYLPWTASPDKGLKDMLLQMIDLTLKNGIRATGEPEYKYKHYQNMTELIDFVLDGRRSYLGSVKNQEKFNVLQHQFESQRFDLIFPLVEDEQYELAAKLAEKYLDFQILVIICDQTDNQQRLDEYIERFKDQDFSQFAISWHMKQNKQGDLFERFKSNQVELAKFLHNHPSLAWIQMIFNGQLEKASHILLELAQNELDLVARKRTMLSLAKLSAFASESDSTQLIVEINKELHLINHQELITPEVAAIFGYDTNNFKVMRPEEIIDLYISEDNETATEEDFRKALELLEYVEDPFEYRHKIWCAAILKDDWVSYNMNAPLDRMQEMLFFKLVDLCYLLDREISNFLPPIDSFLTAPELRHLTVEKAFQYLLKLGYEHINESCIAK